MRALSGIAAPDDHAYTHRMIIGSSRNGAGTPAEVGGAPVRWHAQRPTVREP
ncbi:hypothetical protein QF026_008185 [Streptomyces aurantiacus]|nr:hypothetical protein [Streptomyces aurantiacus]